MPGFIDPRSPNFLGGNNVQNLAIMVVAIVILVKVIKK